MTTPLASAGSYPETIPHSNGQDTWQFPIGIGKRIHLGCLNIAARYPWFRNALPLTDTDTVSLEYETLFAYLKKIGLADTLKEGHLRYPGYFFYSLEKKVAAHGHTRSISGHGIAEEKGLALSKAIGELLERIISGLYNKDTDILIASPDELKKKSPLFYPPQYHRFLPIQQERYRELQYHPTNPIDWMSGVNLITREKTYVPRQITSWFIKSQSHGAPLVNATTSGSAGYFTKGGALLRGLLEGIERDAFLVHWLTQITPRIIRKETLPADMQAKIRRFESLGLSLALTDVTALGIPSVTVVAMDTTAVAPEIVLSGASATTFERAIQDALREMVISSEMFSRTWSAEQLEQSAHAEPFVSRLGQIGRQLYWRGPEKLKQFQWFLSGPPVSYTELCQHDLTLATDDTTQLKVCLETLKERGPAYYPIAYFPKHPIQKKLGFFIAQVYIPKAFPLYLLECQGTFDSDRLQEFAQSKGVTEWELNPWPHMFP